MGSGKSVVGNKLSIDLNLPFIDTDNIIINMKKMNISKIFSLYGEKHFRTIEQKVICNAINNVPKVISTGGGLFINQYSRKLINNKSISIWLKVKIETILNRIKLFHDRPLLNNKNNYFKNISSIINKRNSIYSLAHIHINCDYLSVNSISKLIINKL